MLATPVVVHRGSVNGPRPINIRRDIRQILELLELAFGPVLDADGRRLLSSRADLSSQAAFTMSMNLRNREFNPGFVWEESGRIVGNISLIQSKIPGRYLIANVAVHPNYRRRGIARVLMQEGLEHIGRHRGQEILLQVESSNEAAIHLYYSLGFNTLGMIRRWETNTRRLRNLPVGEAENMEIRPLRRQDWRAAYRLDRASSNPDLHWPAPIAADHYKPGIWQWLNNLLNGQKSETWITTSPVTGEEQRQLIGLASIKSEWGRPHSVELRVLPSWRGEIERPLLAKVIRRLRYLRGDNILLDHLADDEIVNELLVEANFQTRRYLTFMKRKIGG